MKLEAVAFFGRHGDAEDAAAFAEHEVDGFGGDKIRRTDQIAFIFAVFIIDEHDHLAGFESGDHVGDCGEARLGGCGHDFS